VVLRNPVKREKLNLLTGFTNWYHCGKIGITNKEFKRHISLEYGGYALPNSILNKPPLVDWMDFYSDEAEILFFSGIGPSSEA